MWVEFQAKTDAHAKTEHSYLLEAALLLSWLGDFRKCKIRSVSFKLKPRNRTRNTSRASQFNLV